MKIAIAALFIALALAAFGRSLTQGYAPFDDDLLITHNLAIRGPTPDHLKTVFSTFDPELYIPLTFVSYQINYLIGGLHPFIYHLTNILLHAGNAICVAWLLYLLTKQKWLSIFAGLIFVVHPLHTEAVVWLASRKDLLSTVFYLLSFGMYLRYRGQGAVCRTTTCYWVSILFFILALLSKVMAVTLPAILILTDILIEQRRWGRKMIIDKIPYIILSGIFLGIALFGKERIVAEHSFMNVALIASKSVVFYIQKILLPVHLGMFYPYRGEISLLVPAFLMPAAVTALLLGGVVAAWKKFPWFVYGALFFLITVAPTFLNSQKSGEIYFASDRYPYLPSIGILFIVVYALSYVIPSRNSRSEFRNEGHRMPPWARVTGGVLITILTLLSYQQTKIWDSPNALFSNTLRLYPQSVAARISLASLEKDRGKYDQAIKLLRDGIAYGDDVLLRRTLGTVYAKMGRVDDAADQFRQSLELNPRNPEPLLALGVLDEYSGDLAAAKKKYRQAVEMDPSYVSARNHLGSILLEEGNMNEAEVQFRAALDWNPNAEGVHFNLFLILDARGKRDEALEHLEKANELLPDDLQILLSLAEYLIAKDPQRTQELLWRILRTDPVNSDAQRLMKELQ